MTVYHWSLLLGVLLISMVLAGTLLQRLPLSSAMIYLGMGYLLGPGGLGLVAVVDNGKLSGIFTDGDLRRAFEKRIDLRHGRIARRQDAIFVFGRRCQQAGGLQNEIRHRRQ